MAEVDDERWLTTGQVGRLLGVTDRTVANWARAGLFPHLTTPGGHRRFRQGDVEMFLVRSHQPGRPARD